MVEAVDTITITHELHHESNATRKRLDKVAKEIVGRNTLMSPKSFGSVVLESIGEKTFCIVALCC